MGKGPAGGDAPSRQKAPAGLKGQITRKKRGNLPSEPFGSLFSFPSPCLLVLSPCPGCPTGPWAGGLQGAAGWWHLTWGHKAGQEDEPLQGGRGHSHGAGGRGQEVSGRCAAAPDGRRVAKGPRTTLIRPAPRHLAASPEMSRGGSRTKCRAHSQSWPGSFTACAVQRGEQVKSEVIRAWELHGGGTGWCKCW